MSVFTRVSIHPSPAVNRIGPTSLALALVLCLFVCVETAVPQEPPTQRPLQTSADAAITLWQQALLSRNSSQLRSAAATVANLRPLQLNANSLEAILVLMDAATARFPNTEAELARNALQNLLPATLAVPTA
ncbi:MAG: hypothetical protein ACKOEO_16260, partial [Planctomycetaceae bacterium]